VEVTNDTITLSERESLSSETFLTHLLEQASAHLDRKEDLGQGTTEGNH
jgi:hypothetical protein